MKKLNKKNILILFLLIFLTGCGYLDPTKVDREYVQEKIEKYLQNSLGGEFFFQIQEFDEQSERREVTAIAYSKDDSSLSFKVTGSIHENCIDASCYGSSYKVMIDDRFEDILLAKISNELYLKYNLKLYDNVDYDELAKNIFLYLKDFRSLLGPYEDGIYFDMYFDEKFMYGYVPIIFNDELKMKLFVIDLNNNKVVIDYSRGDYGWIGEIEIADYLKYWVDGRLDLVICEIKCNHYPSSSCNCLEEN